MAANKDETKKVDTQDDECYIRKYLTWIVSNHVYQRTLGHSKTQFKSLAVNDKEEKFKSLAVNDKEKFTALNKIKIDYDTLLSGITKETNRVRQLMEENKLKQTKRSKKAYKVYKANKNTMCGDDDVIVNRTKTKPRGRAIKPSAARYEDQSADQIYEMQQKYVEDKAKYEEQRQGQRDKKQKDASSESEMTRSSPDIDDIDPSMAANTIHVLHEHEPIHPTNEETNAKTRDTNCFEKSFASSMNHHLQPAPYRNHEEEEVALEVNENILFDETRHQYIGDEEEMEQKMAGQSVQSIMYDGMNPEEEDDGETTGVDDEEDTEEEEESSDSWSDDVASGVWCKLKHNITCIRATQKFEQILGCPILATKLNAAFIQRHIDLNVKNYCLIGYSAQIRNFLYNVKRNQTLFEMCKESKNFETISAMTNFDMASDSLRSSRDSSKSSMLQQIIKHPAADPHSKYQNRTMGWRRNKNSD